MATETAAETATEVATTADRGTTRERILDVALELFTEQGYDKTSLREIAERVGISKAALYYHFAGKEDMLMALHLRLHDLGRGAFDSLEAKPRDPATWSAFLEEIVGQMLRDRKLFALHERNRAAMEAMHQTKDHDAEHADFEDRFRGLLADPGVSLQARVRISSCLGAILGGMVLGGDNFSDVATDELRQAMLEVVHDILAPLGVPGSAPVSAPASATAWSAPASAPAGSATPGSASAG
ncbi:MAG: TetR/AcrR family transcriptional regulator [Actinomycetota bacterium]